MITLESFFPPCTRKDCDRRGPHADVLPHQRELLESPEKYVALVGGYGAGKTLPASVLGVMLSLQVPGNHGIVVRRSYPKLHDSVMRVYFDTLQRVGLDFREREVRDGWPHRIKLDYKTDKEVAKSALRGKATFLGPVNPELIWSASSPSEVEDAARQALEVLAPGGEFILGPGCALGHTTPADNIHALIETARKYGAYNPDGTLKH